MAIDEKFFGIRLKDHRKLTLQEYRDKKLDATTLPLKGKNAPTDRIYSEYIAYTKHTAAVRKQAAKLHANTKIHQYIFNNSILLEFANLKEITLDWIIKIHGRCEHPPIFPLDKDTYYLWKSEVSEIEALNNGPDVFRKTQAIIDIADKVLTHFQMWQASIRDFIKKAISQTPPRHLSLYRDLGSLQFSENAQRLIWKQEPEDFEQAILRDFTEFYYDNQYCLDLLSCCLFCDKFFVPKDPRKTFCSPKCKDSHHNQKKKRKKSGR